MAEVAIQKSQDGTKSIWSMFDDTRKLFDELQQRAFGLFQERGGGDGRALDDWFRAERELLEIPASEMTEDEKEVHVRAAVPGLKAKDIEVTASPRELIIRGETSERNKGKKGETRFSEFSERRMFRRYDLPSSVDVDKISADLKDGMLVIDMRKAEPAKKVEVKEKAA
jgi:HSP20 family protein